MKKNDKQAGLIAYTFHIYGVKHVIRAESLKQAQEKAAKLKKSKK